ncbi:MAG: hypothetical protein R2827_15070 [Bdellovibrionales bacterium]
MIKNQNTGDLTIDFIKSTVSLKTNSCTTASVPEWEEYCSVEAVATNKNSKPLWSTL